MLKKFLKHQQLLDNRTIVIEIGSSEYRKVLAHAKYLINNVSFNMDFIKKADQIYLNTWHGTPLKCLGRNIQNDSFECNNAQRNFLLCDYLIAPNELTKKVFENDYMVHDIMPGEIVIKGYPRNTIFFDEESRNRIRNIYHLDNVVSIFYMPTWRGTASETYDVDQISEMELLAKDLGDEYRVFVKFHPAMKRLNEGFENCFNVPDDIEVYEFLNAVDILITDYSSVFFDFANTRKPIILYQYDREQYLKGRGIYDEVEQNIPFPIAYNYKELVHMVRERKEMMYPEFNERFCAYDSEMVIKEILQMLFCAPQKKPKRPGTSLYIIDFPVTDKWILAISEKLKGTNYRLVFLPKRNNKYFKNLTCFNQIDYLILYEYNRLTIDEKIINYICKGMYTWGKSKKAKQKMLDFSQRERHRLWGEINVEHVYAKSRHVPIALEPLVEKWPDGL